MQAIKTPIVVSANTDFRVHAVPTIVDVERYIRGEIQDLGGIDKPNALIKLPDGRTLSVRTSKELIRNETQNHIYKQVHLRIRARLNIESGELTDAELLEFVHHSPKFDEEAFRRLTAKGEAAWGDVPDAAEWVRNLRSGG